MTETKRCSRCQACVPPDAPAQLCPNCLLAGGLLAPDSSDMGTGAVDPALAQTTPASGPPFFDVPSPAALAPLFPHLELQTLLGQGGMGAVYRARQLKLDRLVALKIIRPESAANPAFAERFNREARTLARMNHPNIVAIHDFGEVQSDESTLFFFVMEFVDGANLRELLQSDGVTSQQATMIVGQVCEALQYAHDEGIVHRDIKPENVLLDRRGRVKIADFGLARLVAGSTDDFTLTGTHQVMGTPRYMAPEQMAGSRDVDHRADIYSLGVMFYEMLTGTLPLGSFDPPSAKTGGDAMLDRVVLKALASDPQRRFQQVSDFARELYMAAPAPASSMSIHGGDPQPWPGPSTILENAVGGAVDRVRDGRALTWLTHPHSPAIVAVLLAAGQIVAACLTMLSYLLIRGRIGPPHATSLTRIEVAASVSGLSGLALIVVLFAVGGSRRFRGWRPLLILLAAGVETVCFVSGFEAINWRYQTSVEIQTAQLWFVAALCLSVGMLLTGAWDLRRWLHTKESASVEGSSVRRSPSPNPNWLATQHSGLAAPLSSVVDAAVGARNVRGARQNRSRAFDTSSPPAASTLSESVTGEFDELTIRAAADGPSLALIVCGGLLVIGQSVFIGALMQDSSYDRLAGAMLLAWGVVAGLLMVFSGLHFRRFSSLGWARIGAVVACLPTGPAFLITLLAGIYAHRKLDDPLIRRGFIEHGRLRGQQAQADVPRTSGKAIVGAVWAGGFFMLIIPVLAMIKKIRSDPQATWQYGFSWLELMVVLLVLPGLVATPLLGWLALSDIRRSAGRITGFGLAFLDAVCFPTILMNFLLLLGCTLTGHAVYPNAGPGVIGTTVALWFATCFVIDVVVFRQLWRRMRPAEMPSSEVAVTSRDSVNGPQDGAQPNNVERGSRITSGLVAKDSVRLTIQQIDDRNLPDVCMACGEPAVERVLQQFAYQSDVAEILVVAGIFLGILPGLLIDVLTRRTQNVSCPLCPRHVNHFRRAPWWAATGWLLLVPFSGAGYLIGNGIGGSTTGSRPSGPVAGTIVGIVIGLIAWLVPLVVLYTRRIACDRMTDTYIELKRVSSRFARAVKANSESDFPRREGMGSTSTNT